MITAIRNKDKGSGGFGEEIQETDSIIAFENVTKIFKNGLVRNHALDNVTFSIKRDETVAIVGESGSGKTTLGLSAIKLVDIDRGEIYFKGKNISRLKRRRLREFRSQTQMVFQDPYGSLNPYNSVYDSVAAPLNSFQSGMSKSEKREKVLQMLDKVGLRPPESFINEYPKKLSGGQRQRVSIARALIMEPEFIVADEPTSMLDVSISSTVLTLLKNLKKELHFSMLYISHELATARYISDRMAVMNLGRIVEYGKSDSVVNTPAHPYTKLLISSMPHLSEEGTEELEVNLDFDTYNAGIKGCSFSHVCPFVQQDCKEGRPEFLKVGEDHYVACFHPM